MILKIRLLSRTAASAFALWLVLASGAWCFELSSPATYTVLQRSGPDGAVQDLVHIRLAQDEVHNAVVMVDNRSPDGQSIEFRAYVSAQHNARQALPNDAVELSRLLHLFDLSPLLHLFGRTEAADQLLPMTEVDVVGCPAGECRYLWLTVDAHGLQSGEYRTQLRVQSLTPAIETKTIDVLVTVWPFALPERLPLAVFTWDWGQATSSDAWLKEFVEHKVNSWHLPVYRQCELSSDGSLARPLDFSRLTDQIRRGKPYGMFLCESWAFRGLPWPVVGGREAAYMSETWQRGFTEWIRTFVRYLKEQGLQYSQWLWYPYDESMEEGFLEQIKLLHQIDPQIRVFVDKSTGDPEKFTQWAPHVDVWCPQYADPDTHPGSKLIKNSGAKLWNYFCGLQMRPTPFSFRYRLCGWQGWAYGLDGVTFWTSKAWDRGGAMDGRATGTVFPSPRGIVGTRRWEAWRDGLEDYQYCHLLQQLAQQAGESAQLHEIVGRVLALGGAGLSAAEAQCYEEARAKLARMIIRLQSQPAPE